MTVLIAAGGAFELVSCPHYLGEVVLYVGLVAATAGRRATAWLMLLWVVSGLGRKGCPLRARVLHQSRACFFTTVAPLCRCPTCPWPPA